MERISTFNMSADVASLQSALATGNLPGQLNEPMQALVHRITVASTNTPIAIYLCSSDEHAGLRDQFAYLLARTVSQQIPSTLLVDCDFLHVGLHGLVPEADALGFLDLLLYGSSLGVITQQTSGGVKTVGAGSFPVSKRMPFVMGAFDEASRRLAHHARCVIFVGPLFDDESELHALIGAVDMPMLLRESDRGFADAIDPIEERIASSWDLELASVRLVSPAAARPVDEVYTRVLGDDEEDVVPAFPPPSPRDPSVGRNATFAELADVAADDEGAIPPPPLPRRPDLPPEAGPVPPVAQGPESEGAGGRRRRVSPVALIVAVLAVATAAWWIGRDRGIDPGADTAGPRTAANPAANPVATEPPAPETEAQTLVAGADTALIPDGEGAGAPPVSREPSRAVEQVIDEPKYVDPADTGGRSGGTVLLNSHDIHVMEDLQRNWPDQYFIHISSFRRSVEARDDVAFLQSREFPVFIVFLDLAAKGKWYRVYAGPFVTREEAREVKKSLDDIPRVRFTRITKISG